ncbi:TPA: hypothetical protein SLG56_003416 [Proteus mirabilis]|nr:hypothetical protein [Proteus mirabilis]
MKFKISALTACILMTSYSLHAQEDKVERLVVSQPQGLHSNKQMHPLALR